MHDNTYIHIYIMNIVVFVELLVQSTQIEI